LIEIDLIVCLRQVVIENINFLVFFNSFFRVIFKMRTAIQPVPKQGIEKSKITKKDLKNKNLPK